MATILNDTQIQKIKKLNKEFAQKFPGWMCEGSEDAEGRPCNAIFNNDTEEFFRASYSGELVGSPYTTITKIPALLEMAKIQGKIRRIAEGGFV